MKMSADVSKTEQPRDTPKVASKPKRVAQIDQKTLLDSLPHAILVLGPGNTVIYGNPQAEQFFGASLSVLRRGTIDNFLTFGCPFLALVEQARRNRSTLSEYGLEIVLPRLETTELVDVYAGPLIDNDGHLVIMLHQRTMAQMIERQLTHRAAARSVSGMTAVLAHEIKNPLSGIRGAAQLLEPSLSDDDRGLTQLICSETERIRQLLDRMEVFGDERPLNGEPVNVHDVLDHVRQLAGAGFAKNIKITTEFDPSLPPVSGVRDMLVQAFLNLVKNAAEAIDGTGEAGRIQLTTAFRPGMHLSVPGSDTRVSLPLMIEVTDNGGGIPDGMMEHLFDPFVTSKRNGTGLGLALVAKIIRDHGGIIECDSGIRQTTFRILLPLHSSPARATPKR
jgi:two-component system, NtrC family, nitrogen regulation sensor histidine kinase GlnL